MVSIIYNYCIIHIVININISFHLTQYHIFPFIVKHYHTSAIINLEVSHCREDGWTRPKVVGEWKERRAVFQSPNHNPSAESPYNCIIY